MSAPEQERLFTAEIAPLTESVAKLVSTTDCIGRAKRVLEQAGHKVAFNRNRIDVDDLVTVQYIGGQAARWVVWSWDSTQPQWVIGVNGS